VAKDLTLVKKLNFSPNYSKITEKRDVTSPSNLNIETDGPVMDYASTLHSPSLK